LILAHPLLRYCTQQILASRPTTFYMGSLDQNLDLYPSRQSSCTTSSSSFVLIFLYRRQDEEEDRNV
jgi:hypothetical protein